MDLRLIGHIYDGLDHGAPQGSACFTRCRCWRWCFFFKDIRPWYRCWCDGVLVPISGRLALWADDLVFFPIVCRTGFSLLLAYFAFSRGQNVKWSCLDLKTLFILHWWRMGKVIPLDDNRVHERRREVEGRFAYHNCRLLPNAGRFKFGVWLSSLDDTITETGEGCGNERRDPSLGGVAIETPTAAGDNKGDLDSEDTPLGSSSGREHLCMALPNIQRLVSGAELSVSDYGVLQWRAIATI